MSDSFIIWCIIFVISAWGGVVHYIVKRQNQHSRWSWFSLLLQIITSAFTGVLGALLSIEEEQSVFITLVTAAVFSSAGYSVISSILQRIISRSGGKQ
ncbi:hypothetical protein FX356_20085 [Salmonella enterica]|nr:hypothetical protein [Salmonella enterica]EDW9607632.1 hypothetical protein [Salmonella enterica subsp. houtenae serovar 50:z4,z23:-]ECJ9883981.1 hypothetical protein [Salmonella enterica]ECO9619375.1 hypothetical protein [Salmonella enterica]EDV8901881.1 hypothetical protein [Salmonella enterica]